MELSFVEEEIPKIVRQGGSGREAEPWETHLAPLKGKDMASKSYRVWTYANKNSAPSHMNTVRDRLYKVTPQDNWDLKVRPVPNTDPVQYGLWVQYDGAYTPEQVIANAEARQKRSARQGGTGRRCRWWVRKEQLPLDEGTRGDGKGTGCGGSQEGVLTPLIAMPRPLTSRFGSGSGHRRFLVSGLGDFRQLF